VHGRIDGICSVPLTDGKGKSAAIHLGDGKLNYSVLIRSQKDQTAACFSVKWK